MFATKPITDLSLIQKYRESTSALIRNQYFAEFNAQTIEPQRLILGGSSFHPDAQEMVCYLHKRRDSPQTGNSALVYFRGGGCVYGSAEHR